VVNYHRVEDLNRPGFDSFKPNISAHPQEFDRQMAYLKEWFNVITLETLVDWLDQGSDLPPYAALITFDDGYLDNYTHAYTILRQHGLPALIFLTTGHIGTDAAFSWDLAAYCFYHSGRGNILFPDGVEQRWADRAALDGIIKAWVEALKTLPEAERQQWSDRLPGLLDVSVPQGYFRRLMLDWDLVREMNAGGISFGGHTVTHPILTRIPEEQARAEIRQSKAKIEKETANPVLAFAYPNGMSADFSSGLISAVTAAGYRTAFTLLNGPTTWRAAKEHPFEIRRIFISHRHTLPDFAALLSPLNRLLGN
jgi:prepilin-type processing-associated H-X9-DG protein